MGAATVAASGAPPPNRWLFEENLGQAPAQAQYVARVGGGEPVLLDGQGALFPGSGIRLRFGGAAAPEARWQPEGEAKGGISYFLGADETRWVRGARQYERVAWRGVYPGVDAVFYFTGAGRVEYDLVLHPGADPRRITVCFDGAPAQIGGDGEIALGSVLRQRAPVIFQEDASGVRTQVAGGFQATGRPGEFSLRLGRYEPARKLVVDPVLEFSTYFGGDGDDRVTVLSDRIVAGSTASVRFFETEIARRRERDVFVRYEQQSGFISSWIFGGSGDDEVAGAFVSGSSTVAVFGTTASRNLPGAINLGSTYRGGASDGFIASLATSPNFGPALRYVGGSGADRIQAVAMLNGGYVLAGVTDSPDLTVIRSGQPRLAGGTDAFYATGFAFSSNLAVSVTGYLGGSGDDRANAVAFDGTQILIGGETRSADFPLAGSLAGERRGPSDAFLARLGSSGLGLSDDPALVDSRLIGGIGEDRINAIATRPFAQAPVVVAGATTSADFPLLEPLRRELGGASDAFVMKLAPRTGEPVFSTLLGGSGDDAATSAAYHRSFDDYAVAGWTTSQDLAVVEPLQPASGGGADGFFGLFDNTNQPAQLTYFGGAGDDRIHTIHSVFSQNFGAVEPYAIGGETTSENLPTYNSLQALKNGGVDGFHALIGTSIIHGPSRMALGKDLRTFVDLRPAQTGGARVTVRSSDPSRVRIVTEFGSFGELTLAPGESWGVQVEALADSGEVQLTAEAPGFARKVVRLVLMPARITHAMQVPSLRISAWSSSPPRLDHFFTAWNPETDRVEGLGWPRPELGDVTVTWNSSDESVVRIRALQGEAPVMALAGPGTARLQVSSNRFQTFGDGISVSVETPRLEVGTVTVSKDLMAPLPYSFVMGNGLRSDARGTVTARSLTPDLVLLSTDPRNEAQQSVSVAMTGFGVPAIFVHGLASAGDARVELTSSITGETAVAVISLVPGEMIATYSNAQREIQIERTASAFVAVRAQPRGATFSQASLRPGVSAPGFQIAS